MNVFHSWFMKIQIGITYKKRCTQGNICKFLNLTQILNHYILVIRALITKAYVLKPYSDLNLFYSRDKSSHY